MVYMSMYIQQTQFLFLYNNVAESATHRHKPLYNNDIQGWQIGQNIADVPADITDVVGEVTGEDYSIRKILL